MGAHDHLCAFLCLCNFTLRYLFKKFTLVFFEPYTPLLLLPFSIPPSLLPTSTPLILLYSCLCCCSNDLQFQLDHVCFLFETFSDQSHLWICVRVKSLPEECPRDLCPDLDGTCTPSHPLSHPLTRPNTDTALMAICRITF